MKFDDLTKHIGEFGPYQKRMYLLVCLPAISFGIQMLSAVFILAIPDHRCKVPNVPNDTYAVQGENHQCWINQTIPQTTEADAMYEACEMYVTGNDSTCNADSETEKKKVKCNEWVYDMTDFQTTFIQVHNLICDQRTLRLHANMILFAGLVAGAIVTGLVGDIFGRKKALIMVVILHVGGTIGQGFAPNYIALVILKFVTGFSAVGLFLVVFVIGMELVGPSKRMFAGIFIEFFWVGGLFVLLLFAYFIRHWNYLQMAVSFPTIILFIYCWIVPESTRWLISHGRVEEAKIILDKVAKANKTQIPEGLVEQIAADEKEESLRKAFKSPIMIIRTLIIFLNWAVVSMIYYGLGLNVGSLHGDRYLNFLIANVVEAVSYVFLLVALRYWGRKPVHCGTLIFGGIACLCTIFTVLYGGKSLQWTTVVLAMAGKFGVSAAFATIYVWTAELYPTPMRNSGVGLGSMCARIGGTISPYIADLGNLVDGGEISTALPLIVFGAAAVIAGLLGLLLPETMHEQMPETLDDAVNMGKKSSKTKYYMNGTSPDDGHNSIYNNKTFIEDNVNVKY